MKALKIKVYYKEEGLAVIHQDANFNGYPAGYNPQKFHEIAYGNNPEDMGEDDGGKFKYIVAICTDDNYAPGRSERISKADAAAFGDKYWGGHVGIGNKEVVGAILGKVHRNEPLTAEDRKAIDPDDPTPGMNRRKRFSDILNERGVQ